MSISNPPNFGSPDWQRGYYSAQKLLSSQPSTSQSVVVTVPPNTETIAVYTNPNPFAVGVQCIGQTSGVKYPGFPLTPPSNSTIGNTVMFDVSSAIDSQVEILWGSAPEVPWYVVADSGTRVTVSPIGMRSEGGYSYAIPIVPSTFGSDHPPNELSNVSAIPQASGGFLGSPGAGKRYRLFCLTMSSAAAGLVSQLSDAVSGTAYAVFVSPGSLVIPVHPQGIPMATDAGLNYGIVSGSGGCAITAMYTVETL